VYIKWNCCACEALADCLLMFRWRVHLSGHKLQVWIWFPHTDARLFFLRTSVTLPYNEEGGYTLTIVPLLVCPRRETSKGIPLMPSLTSSASTGFRM
jgi:hypothetical protein